MVYDIAGALAQQPVGEDHAGALDSILLYTIYGADSLIVPL